MLDKQQRTMKSNYFFIKKNTENAQIFEYVKFDISICVKLSSEMHQDFHYKI